MADERQVNSGKTKSGMGGRWQAVRRSAVGSLFINLLAALFVIALVQTFFVKMYVVPSASMQETLRVGDRILVNRTAYAGGVPPRGDVVVFSADEHWQEPGREEGNAVKDLVRYFGDFTGIGPSHENFLVKRVIGVPGDVVECCGAEGQLSVNQVAQEELYLQGGAPFEAAGVDCKSTPGSARCFGPVTVPAGKLLVLGDNRNNSNDSVYGCRGGAVAEDCLKWVAVENVVGHTFATVLPLNRIGAVR